MSSLITLGIKGKDGKYKNYTVSISDQVNEYGQNVSMFVEQTKEERDAKKSRQYVGNGKVVWTDGNIYKAQKESETLVDDDSPF